MADFIILDQTPSYLLQETGDKILLETQGTITPPPIPPVVPPGASGIFDSINPTFLIDSEQNIHMTVELTQAQLNDQGYTYNQPGFTYNQIGVAYGGIYRNNQDISPVFFNDTATLLTPIISSIINVATGTTPPPSNSGMLMGILGLTYP